MNNILSSLAELLVTGLENRKNKKMLEREQIQNIRYLNNKEMIYQRFKKDYEDFAGKLNNCLQSNYSFCGLFRPLRIEDIYCQNWFDMIDGILFDNGGYQDIVFRFEIWREALHMNVHTITTGTFKYVPVVKAEQLLQADLPKYCGEFCYVGLSVTEIADEKVRITVSGVDRPSPLSGGMMVW